MNSGYINFSAESLNLIDWKVAIESVEIITYLNLNRSSFFHNGKFSMRFCVYVGE
jgi:hypothetical protein